MKASGNLALNDLFLSQDSMAILLLSQGSILLSCSGEIIGIWLPGKYFPCLLWARSATTGNKSDRTPA